MIYEMDDRQCLECGEHYFAYDDGIGYYYCEDCREDREW
jgi:hypothetical protein